MAPKSVARPKQGQKYHTSPSRAVQEIKVGHDAAAEFAQDEYLRSFIQSAHEQPRSRHTSLQSSPAMQASQVSESSVVDPQVARVLEESEQERNQLIQSIFAKTQGGVQQPSDVLRRLILVEQRLGIEPSQQPEATAYIKALARVNLKNKLVFSEVSEQTSRIDVQAIQLREMQAETRQFAEKTVEQLDELGVKVQELENGTFELEKCGNLQEIDPRLQALEARENKIIQIIRSQKEAIESCINIQNNENLGPTMAFEQEVDENKREIKEVKELVNVKVSSLENKLDAVSKCEEEVISRLEALELTRNDAKSERSDNSLPDLDEKFTEMKIENANMLLLINQLRKAEGKEKLQGEINELKHDITGQIEELEDYLDAMDPEAIREDIETLYESVDRFDELVGSQEEVIEKLELQFLDASANIATPAENTGKPADIVSAELERLNNAVSDFANVEPILEELNREILLIDLQQKSQETRLDQISENQGPDYSTLEAYCQDETAYITNQVEGLKEQMRQFFEENGGASVLNSGENAGEIAKLSVDALEMAKQALLSVKEELYDCDIIKHEAWERIEGELEVIRDEGCRGCAQQIGELKAAVETADSAENKTMETVSEVVAIEKETSEEVEEIHRQLDFIQEFFMAGIEGAEEYSEQDTGEAE